MTESVDTKISQTCPKPPPQCRGGGADNAVTISGHGEGGAIDQVSMQLDPKARIPIGMH